MKMIQGDQDADGPQQANEPPAVDDRFSLDIQDQEMVKENKSKKADHKTSGRHRTVCRSDHGYNKRDEDKNRQQVQKMKYGSDVEKPYKLAPPNVLGQIRL